MKIQSDPVDTYISQFPPEISKRLTLVRQTIKKLIPEAAEDIRYGMPTFRLKEKNLIHFAGYKEHIGIYPAPEAIDHFSVQLRRYKTSKGAIQIPHKEELPLELLRALTLYRRDAVLSD